MATNRELITDTLAKAQQFTDLTAAERERLSKPCPPGRTDEQRAADLELVKRALRIALQRAPQQAKETKRRARIQAAAVIVIDALLLLDVLPTNKAGTQ